MSCRNVPERLDDGTMHVWRRRTSRQLSEVDAREIVENVTGFFKTLLEWERAETKGEALEYVDLASDMTGWSGGERL